MRRQLVSSNIRRCRGFTLFELMVVVTIIAILGALAGPALFTLVSTQRLRNASFDLVSDLLAARSASLNQQADVVITPTAVSGGEWVGGWTVTSPSGTVTSRAGILASVKFAPADSNGAAVTSLTFQGANGGRL